MLASDVLQACTTFVSSCPEGARLENCRILSTLLQNVQREPSVAQAFYQSFLLVLIQDTLAVMTDRLHKSGFKMHATLLRHIFHLVEGGHVTAPLFDPAAQPAGQTNPAFLREHVANLLIASFPNLTKAQVLSFVVGLFDLGTDLSLIHI